MGLFSKKPGGTLFGNILRGVGSKIAPGILGTGKNMIPATAASYPTAPTPISQAASVIGQYYAETPQGQAQIKGSAMEALKNSPMILVALIAAVGFIIFKLIKN